MIYESISSSAAVLILMLLTTLASVNVLVVKLCMKFLNDFLLQHNYLAITTDICSLFNWTPLY